jgi:glycosyltransferase involved in cell wall biosynthesis
MGEENSFKKKVKLIIQIPCYNEETTLPLTLDSLPRKIPGIDTIEWLIINDGSTDKTAKVAKLHGVDHIISHPQNMGLAKAFMKGIEACLEREADIIVNTDADNQYRGDSISDLIQPILEGKAEFVVGARPIDEIKDFSRTKKILQKLGSWTVRLASGTNVRDAPSGFRAISRNAAQKMNVFNNYSYTLETIIQAGQNNIPITWVPIKTNRVLRPSKLLKSIPSYIRNSIVTIVRIFVVYKAFRFFATIGILLFTLGGFLIIRFLYYYFSGKGGGFIQSLIIASILIGMGFQTILIAFIADLISVNRRLLEKLNVKGKNQKNEFDLQ